MDTGNDFCPRAGLLDCGMLRPGMVPTKMRILIVVYVFPPEHAPAGVMMQELAEELAADGHEVTVLTGWPNHPKGRLFPGWKMRWFSLSGEGSYRLARVAHALGAKTGAMRRLWIYLTFALSSLLNGWRLGRQDVVVCLSTPIFGVWTTWLLARLRRARHVRVTFDVWPESIRNAGLMSDNLVYRVARHIDTLNCRWSDVITVLGHGMKQQLLDRGLAERTIQIIPFWIDAKRIQPLERDNAWRREQGIGPEKFVALFAGTIGFASGAQILADVAAELAGQDEVILLVVGEGPVKVELEDAARKRELKNMRFLPFQPEERLAEMQSAADVGLVTLLPESGLSSVPSKVLGYMAAGRAVIASAPADTDTAKLI